MLTHCGTMQAGRVSGAAELCLSLAALGNFSSLSLDFLLFKMGVLGGLHDRRYTESLSTRQGAEPLLVGCDLISHASSWACGKGLENFLVVNVKKKKKCCARKAKHVARLSLGGDQKLDAVWEMGD